MQSSKKDNIFQQLSKDQQKIEMLSQKKMNIYGERLNPDNILGKHFKIQQLRKSYPGIKLGTEDYEIPVFAELKIHKPKEIKRPPTPDLVKKIRKQREEMEKCLEN